MPEQIGKRDGCEDGGPVVEIGIGVCHGVEQHEKQRQGQEQRIQTQEAAQGELPRGIAQHAGQDDEAADGEKQIDAVDAKLPWPRSEEHTSELQSLMRNSYAVFCLKKTTKRKEPQYQ